MSDARNPPLDRHTFGWCAASVCAALLPLAPTLPPWLVALTVALAAIGTVAGLRGAVLSAWVRLPLTLGVATAVLFAYRFNFGRDTGAALLVSMLALKLLETRRVRDARSVLSFALFAVMAAFLQDQAPTTLLLALLATALVLATLARVADVESPGVLPPVAARARLGGIVRLVAVSLPLAMVGFFLFPRLANPLWGLPENSAEARTGLSDEMAPGDIVALYVDETPVMRVSFQTPPPPANSLYWRGPVLSIFDGRRWIRSNWSSSNLPPAALEPLGPAVRYRVSQEPTDRRYLMLLDVPAEAPEQARIGLDRMAFRRRPQTLLTNYDGVSYTRYRFEPRLSEVFRRSLTELPTGFNPRTLAQVREWQAQGLEGEAIVRRALQWFSAEFTYTLQPTLLGRDSVDDFLFNTKAGYCEHFSSAFVVMMRAAGIPARVVTGYQGGRANDVGGYLVVRQSDAHAWAEVWLPENGWVRVDPTSAVAPQRIERGSESLAGPETAWSRFTKPLFDATDFVRRGWNELVLGFNAARQRSLLGSLGVDRDATPQFGLVLAAGIGAALALTLWLLLRGPREPRDALGRAWGRFQWRLARAGVRKARHEGPIDFARRAARDLPHAAERVAALSDRYARHRYARAIPDPGDEARLCADLRSFRVPGKRASTRSTP